MPRVVHVAVPMSVETATRVFGAPVRVALIRHYTEHPGPQKAAAQSLGVTHRLVSVHTGVLVKAGVVVKDPADDGRTAKYRVDQARVEELLAALRSFATGEP